MKSLIAEVPSWITPGDAVALAWYSGRGESAIQNDAGVWSCRLHPFEFLKEAA